MTFIRQLLELMQQEWNSWDSCLWVWAAGTRLLIPLTPPLLFWECESMLSCCSIHVFEKDHHRVQAVSQSLICMGTRYVYCQALSFVICEWSLWLCFVNYPQNCVRSKLLIVCNQPAHRFGLWGTFIYAYISHCACNSGVSKRVHTSIHLPLLSLLWTLLIIKT